MPINTIPTSTRGRYTYDQFRQEAQNSGLLGEFSASDLALAQRNPDAGMSLLSYKRDWHNATTDAERELANLGAETVRSSYGSYTGGNDGSQFYLEPLSPNMFEYGSAPTFSGGAYSDIVDDLYGQLLDYPDFSYGDAPDYTSRWDETLQGMYNDLLNRPDFTYDPETDPLYSQYRKQYIREGNRATADALGAAAAASGGLPSSYAQTAAGQAGNYYAAQLTDMIPQLWQLAYDKYLNDYQMDVSNIGVIEGAEANDYNKYLTDLNQFNTDRDFAYGTWLDRYNMLNNNLQTGQGLDDIAFDRYLAELQQYNTDRDFAYGQFLDEINDQTADRQEYLNLAQIAADVGDYNWLNNLGIDTSALLPSGSGYTGGGDEYTADRDDEESDSEGRLTSSQSEANANQLYNSISRIPGLTEENKVMMVRDAYNNGRISLEDQNRLIRQLGYAS